MDVPVDEGGVELLGLIQKQLILENLVLCCEQVFFVGLAFLDNGAALPDLAILAGDFLLRAYPLSVFIVEHASGGDLYIRLRQQTPFGKEYSTIIMIIL